MDCLTGGVVGQPGTCCLAVFKGLRWLGNDPSVPLRLGRVCSGALLPNCKKARPHARSRTGGQVQGRRRRFFC